MDLLSLEAPLRLGLFAGLFGLLALAELRWPRRSQGAARGKRWTANFGLVLIDSLLLRLLFPVLAVAAALRFEAAGFGLFNWVEAPPVLAFGVAILVLDLAIYGQHRLVHAVPWLWRLHRVHHTDLHLDASSGVRFHPVEILLSMAWKLLVIALLGAPALAVLVFEVLLNLGSLFTHANIRLPEALDRRLRWLVVTPDMHRIHHSVHRDEERSNYGFHLSIWDRLFASYREQPRDGHTGMLLGVEGFRQSQGGGLLRLLMQPLLATDNSTQKTANPGQPLS